MAEPKASTMPRTVTDTVLINAADAASSADNANARPAGTAVAKFVTVAGDTMSPTGMPVRSARVRHNVTIASSDHARADQRAARIRRYAYADTRP